MHPVVAASGAVIKPAFSINRTRYTLLLRNADVGPNLTVFTTNFEQQSSPIVYECWGYSLLLETSLYSHVDEQLHVDEQQRLTRSGYHLLQLPRLCDGCTAVCDVGAVSAHAAPRLDGTEHSTYSFLLVAPSVASSAAPAPSGLPGPFILFVFFSAIVAAFVWSRGHRGRVRRKLQNEFGLESEQEGGWSSYSAL